MMPAREDETASGRSRRRWMRRIYLAGCLRRTARIEDEALKPARTPFPIDRLMRTRRRRSLIFPAPLPSHPLSHIQGKISIGAGFRPFTREYTILWDSPAVGFGSKTDALSSDMELNGHSFVVGPVAPTGWTPVILEEGRSPLSVHHRGTICNRVTMMVAPILRTGRIIPASRWRMHSQLSLDFGRVSAFVQESEGGRFPVQLQIHLDNATNNAKSGFYNFNLFKKIPQLSWRNPNGREFWADPLCKSINRFAADNPKYCLA